MPAVGFEHTIPASERPKSHALDRAATGVVWAITSSLIIPQSASNLDRTECSESLFTHQQSEIKLR